MKSSQDNRRISSEEWSQLRQSTRRRIQTLASPAQFDKTNSPTPPAA